MGGRGLRACGAVAAAVCLGAATAAAQATNTVAWRVAALRLAGSNAVWRGAEAVPLAAFTNRLGQAFSNDVEAVLIHGGVGGDAVLRVPPELIAYLMAQGKHVLVDAGEADAAAGADAADPDVRAITVKTSYLRVFDKPAGPADERRLADEVSVGSTFDVDTARGTYELREVGVGLMGDRLWLVHGLPMDATDEGSVGVQFRRDW